MTEFPTAYVRIVAQLIGVDVTVVVGGPVQIGQPLQVERMTGGTVPPTQHSEVLSPSTAKTPWQSYLSRWEILVSNTIASVCGVAYLLEVGDCPGG